MKHKTLPSAQALNLTSDECMGIDKSYRKSKGFERRFAADFGAKMAFKVLLSSFNRPLNISVEMCNLISSAGFIDYSMP